MEAQRQSLQGARILWFSENKLETAGYIQKSAMLCVFSKGWASWCLKKRRQLQHSNLPSMAPESLCCLLKNTGSIQTLLACAPAQQQLASIGRNISISGHQRCLLQQPASCFLTHCRPGLHSGPNVYQPDGLGNVPQVLGRQTNQDGRGNWV